MNRTRRVGKASGLMCALLLGVYGNALAQQVFKCTVNGVTTYAQHPCGEKPKSVELNVYQPNSYERTLARQRAAADRRDAAVVDLERQQLEAERRAERAQRDAKSAAFAEKCANYERKAQNAAAERDMYFTPGYKAEAEGRRKAAADAHFSECYGNR